MFIEKDNRKIPEILGEKVKQLKLGRREAEFAGSVKALCSPQYQEALSELEYLSLYDNKLKKLNRISLLKHAPLKELSLGRNLLSELPDEVSELTSVENLWLDDNQFLDFPAPLLSMPQLKVLRLCGNNISKLPDEIDRLVNLEVLTLEGNNLSSIPESIGNLTNLKTLLLRGNKITHLPESLGNLQNLTMLTLSGNGLEQLPSTIGNLNRLETLMANGNKLHELPDSLAACRSLKKVNLANNEIGFLPEVVAQRWKKSLTPQVLAASRAGAGSQSDGPDAAMSEGKEGEGSESSNGSSSLSINLDGNPVSRGTGYGISETQFSQPMTSTWQKRLKK